MAKILLSQEVKRVQNELRRLSTLFRKLEKFELTLNKEGKDIKQQIGTWIQDNINLLGSYSVDDVDGNLDINKSVIANLSIAVSNITAILDREKTYTTQADLLRVLTEAKAYTDTEVAKLKVEVDTIKSAGVHIPHFTDEANRDRAIPNPVDGQVCYVGANGAWVLNTYEAGAWVKGTVSQHSTTGADPTKADLDLSNVNVGANNTGKLFRIKADGTLEYIDEAIKHLENINTQAELFNAVNQNEEIKLTINGKVFIGNVEAKTADQLGVYGRYYSGGEVNLYIISARKDNQAGIGLLPYTPKNDNSILNKKYVDEKLTPLKIATSDLSSANGQITDAYKRGDIVTYVSDSITGVLAYDDTNIKYNVSGTDIVDEALNADTYIVIGQLYK